MYSECSTSCNSVAEELGSRFTSSTNSCTARERVMAIVGKVLVLGATGGIGGETARQLRAAGWHVRALHRDPRRVAAAEPRFEWIAGDAMNGADVLAAARGADVILHAVNPP